jgi:hypothetical protein
MNRKAHILVVLILLLSIFLTACLGPAAEYPDKETASRDAELMGGLDETVSTPGKVNESQELKQNEDLQEMKHWQYGIDRQSASESPEAVEEPKPLPLRRTATMIPTEDYSRTVSIQIMTAAEMDAIMNKLISSGYLVEPAASQEEFQDAVSAFQNDQGIGGTGELNSETLTLLRNI